MITYAAIKEQHVVRMPGEVATSPSHTAKNAAVIGTCVLSPTPLRTTKHDKLTTKTTIKDATGNTMEVRLVVPVFSAGFHLRMGSCC
jgi:alpha-ketoglutarate-dependent taurine dioxygenase